MLDLIFLFFLGLISIFAGYLIGKPHWSVNTRQFFSMLWTTAAVALLLGLRWLSIASETIDPVQNSLRHHLRDNFYETFLWSSVGASILLGWSFYLGLSKIKED